MGGDDPARTGSGEGGSRTMTALDAGPNTAADVEAVEEIMRRGGPGLRERMARTEAHLAAVTAEAGAPLASHASATVAAGGKRLRPLLVVLAAEAAGGPGEGEGASRVCCAPRWRSSWCTRPRSSTTT